MVNYLSRLQITIEPERILQNGVLTTFLQITISRFGKDDLMIKRIIPDNDFESNWDYIWDGCKILLDDELKRTDKEF